MRTIDRKKRMFWISLPLSFTLFVGAGCFLPQTTQVASAWSVYKEQLQANKPVPTVHFTQHHPASIKPVLTWTKVTGAVCYELELLSAVPKTSETAAPTSLCLYSTKKIFVNGFNVALPLDFESNSFYWRVRALDIDGKPIGPFSDPEKVYVDHELETILKPLPTSIFNQTTGATLLYPVYSWIPISGADKYEVEILDDMPENPNGTAPSVHRIDAAIATGFDYYDEKPRISEKPFYWRVRGLDSEGNPVGVYSDAGQFRVDPLMNVTVATFGDSITHGGGSISYSPADWEYSYQHYLSFATINLGKSGDTSQTMVDRFDQDVLPFHPQYLIILAGTNSLRGGVSAEDVIADLNTLKEKCLANHVRPVFLTLPPINPDNIQRVFNEGTAPDWQNQMQLVNDFIRTQVYIDITGGMADENGILFSNLALDGLHLDITGKKKMASAINANWPRITSLSWQD